MWKDEYFNLSLEVVCLEQGIKCGGVHNDCVIDFDDVSICNCHQNHER